MRVRTPQEHRERLGSAGWLPKLCGGFGAHIWTLLFAAGSSRPMNGHSGAAGTACTDSTLQFSSA
eukprot:302684-Prymnesium_polylepis.1